LSGLSPPPFFAQTFFTPAATEEGFHLHLYAVKWEENILLLLESIFVLLMNDVNSRQLINKTMSVSTFPSCRAPNRIRSLNTFSLPDKKQMSIKKSGKNNFRKNSPKTRHDIRKDLRNGIPDKPKPSFSAFKVTCL
jgi:hypothetical protein